MARDSWRRRELLGLLSAGGAARWLTGCDRLLIYDNAVTRPLEPITSNEDHYVYQAFGIPSVDPSTHRTRVLYRGGELASFDLATLERLGAEDKEHTLQCIGSSPSTLSISNAVWSGLPLAEVLAALGAETPPGAVDLRFEGADVNVEGLAYHASVPVADLLDGPVWLAWRMNGEPVPLEHGGPYRLLTPGRYGVKNVKWPAVIEFMDEPHVSFWTLFGWEEAATYKPNVFVLTPEDRVAVDIGERLRFGGCAFAGADPVTEVEISLDDGPWEPARLDYLPGPDIWVLWSWDWVATAGEHTLQARCRTASGAESVLDPGGTDPLRGYDGSMRIRVVAG